MISQKRFTEFDPRRDSVITAPDYKLYNWMNEMLRRQMQEPLADGVISRAAITLALIGVVNLLGKYPICERVFVEMVSRARQHNEGNKKGAE
jgi:hypothetical protein